MTFLFDTNVVSEWVKPQPNAGIVEWLAGVDEDAVFISVVTLAELRYGIDRMPAGKRRTRLHAWLAEDLPARFAGRVLGVDATVADLWGVLMAKADALGRPTSSTDACVAAIAQNANLTVITRNVRDFTALGVPTTNPWR